MSFLLFFFFLMVKYKQQFVIIVYQLTHFKTFFWQIQTKIFYLSPAFTMTISGVCGGSASGKTTVAEKIIESLSVPWVTLLSMDSFYKVLNEKQHEIADNNEYNFDHPDAFDFDLLIATLQKLKEGRKVEVPIYNFVTHSRENRTV